MNEQPRRTQRYAIEHLRCMLAEDLRNACVVEGWTDLEVDKLVARLYGSFLDSSLCRPEYREFYGHYGMQTYRDPFPEGHVGPLPKPNVRLGAEEETVAVPRGYLERVTYVDRTEAEIAAYLASLPPRPVREEGK